MSRLDHPGYFAFIPASSTFPGALGDFIASALNVYVGSWMEAAGPSQLELIGARLVQGVDRLSAGRRPGVLVSGGSAANMTALACAREALLGPMSDRVVAYVSDQAHSSLARAARLLGFRPDQLRVLPTDADHRLRARRAVGAIDADAAAGRQPLFVAANAGATNTGAIDPLDELAAICREHGVWLHVDAAYGGFAALTERGRAALAGSSWPTRSRSTRTSGSTSRSSAAACSCARAAAARRVHDHPRLPRRRQGRGGQLLGPRPAADPRLAGAEDLAVVQLLRRRRVPRRDRPLARPGAAGRGVRPRPETLELLSPAPLGIVCFRRRFDGVEDEARSSASTPRSCAFEAHRPGPSVLDAAARDATRSGSAC